MPRITYACTDAEPDVCAGEPVEPEHDLDIDAFEEESE